MSTPIDADDRWKNGKYDHDGNDIMNAFTNIRHRPAQRVSTENHGADPKNPTKNIEGQIAGIRHLCRAGNGRTERSNDRNETREDDGPATILFVEFMGALKMASSEEKGVFAAVQGRTRRAADPIPNLIAHDGAKHDRQEKPLEGNHAGSRENSGSYQQGITRKKKTYKKTGFNEDDRTNEGRAAGAD